MSTCIGLKDGYSLGSGGIVVAEEYKRGVVLNFG
jgi:hypothetical protein